MSLYANDYNKNLANNLNHLNYALANRSKLTNTKNDLKGGSIMRSTDNKNMYIQDLQQIGNRTINNGNSPNYPFLNMSELQRLDKERTNPLYYQRLHNSTMKGGDIWGDIGKFFKPIGSAILDVGAPALGAVVGGPMGAVAAKAVREGVRGVSGVGLKRGRKAGGAKTAGVGVYSAGAKRLSPEVKQARLDAKMAKKAEREAKKQAKIDAKQAKMDAKQAKMDAKISKPKRMPKSKSLPSLEGGKRKASAGTKKRAEIVKKVMADMGLKMIDASKYVKKNNLY
jgi:hypothetical protein